MKKIIQPLLMLLLLLLFTGILSAFGQDEESSFVNYQLLLQTADEEIFIRAGFSQDFSENQGYVNEFVNPMTIHQYYIYDGEGSDTLMTMQPSEEVIHTTNKRLKFDNYRKNEFHAKYTVVRREDIPVNEGGICWIRYSDVLSTGVGKESGVIFYPGGKVYHFQPVDGEMVYEEIGDLSDIYPDSPAAFDFIRIDGTTYVYINEKYIMHFEDGISGNVSFEAGAELFQGGNRVRCCFDDFSIKIR